MVKGNDVGVFCMNLSSYKIIVNVIKMFQWL